MSDPARNRWLAIVGVRFVFVAVAVLGVLLLGRSEDWPVKILGLAIVLTAMGMMLVVPKALARKWRTPPET